MGGDQVDYPGKVTTHTPDLVTVKCFLNHVVSTPGAQTACFDIKDYFLNNVLPRSEYIMMPVKLIPEEIMDHHNLHDKVHSGFVYSEVNKGMCGLPQAGRVANDALLPRLAAKGYRPAGQTRGLYKSDSNSILFV